jgi:hypothetical protein
MQPLQPSSRQTLLGKSQWPISNATNRASRWWLFVIFDTAGEVIFARASILGNRFITRVRNVHAYLLWTSPAVGHEFCSPPRMKMVILRGTAVA